MNPRTCLIHAGCRVSGARSRPAAQPINPTTMTKTPIRIEIVPPTAVEWAAIHPFTNRRRGSTRSGNRIVATMGTKTVLVAIAV